MILFSKLGTQHWGLAQAQKRGGRILGLHLPLSVLVKLVPRVGSAPLLVRPPPAAHLLHVGWCPRKPPTDFRALRKKPPVVRSRPTAFRALRKKPPRKLLALWWLETRAGTLGRGTLGRGTLGRGTLGRGTLESGALESGALESGALESAALESGALVAGALDATPCDETTPQDVPGGGAPPPHPCDETTPEYVPGGGAPPPWNLARGV